jgi:hypothetical protein
MLPGFRFLFVATVFSMSVLVFGLGAAALLRAAHEEFASTPSWRAPPETVFAQPSEAPRPVLAMLHVNTPVDEKPSGDVPAATAPAEPPANNSVPAEPETVAALKETSAETAKPEIPVSEASPPSEAAPVQADAAASAGETMAATDAPASAEEARIAATEQVTPPANEAAPAASEPISVQPSPATDILSTKIATLGGPAVTIEAQPPAKAASEKPDKDVIKERLKARRAALRRRRARMAAQVLPQPVDPFGQPMITVRSR